jgi:hypothetical protein
MKETFDQMLTYGPQSAEQWDLSDPGAREAYEDHLKDLRHTRRADLQRPLVHALAWRCGAKLPPEEEFDEGICLTEARRRLPMYRSRTTELEV